MIMLVAKALRLCSKKNFVFSSFCRIIYLRLKYPGLRIDFKSRIEKGCKIVCVDGGKMNITNSFISYGTHLFADSEGHISMNGAFIGRNCIIVSKKKIEIKNGCAIAEMVVIRDQNHQIDFNNMGDTLYHFDVEDIQIGENVWIGAKATILKGVTIGDEAVIAASAVIIKSIPAGEIWGGVPAKYLKSYDYHFNRTKFQADIPALESYQVID